MLHTSIIRFGMLVLLLGAGTAALFNDAATGSADASAGSGHEQTAQVDDIGRPAAVKEMWHQLGLSQPRSVFRFNEAYSAGKWSKAYAGGDVTVIVQQLSDRHRNDWEDLVYVRTDERYAFVGAWDMPVQLGRKPRYTVINGGMGDYFLSVDYNYSSTKACRSIKEEAWLALQGGLTDVVQFPVAASGCQGPVNGERLDYNFTGYRQWEIGGRHWLELSYNVQHFQRNPEGGDQADDEAQPVVFAHDLKLRLVWQDGKYVIDERNSDGGIDSNDSGGLVLDPDTLLQRKRDGLVRLARYGNDGQMKWLQELLQLKREANTEAVQTEIEKRNI